MKRLRLTLAYDGGAFSGWQAQPNGNTIQQYIQSTILKISGETVVVHGSGRTDAGVHARAQEAHFDTMTSMPAAEWQRGLNALLPPDIRILRVRIVDPRFHARHDVLSKEYRYRIWNGAVVPPFVRRYRAHVTTPLNTEAMRQAAAMLTGIHDFSAFAANPNRDVPEPERDLKILDVSRHGADITVRAVSQGFLYKMVRSLAGHLIKVGAGAIAAKETAAILDARRRTAIVQTAPPQGLFLWQASYPPAP